MILLTGGAGFVGRNLLKELVGSVRVKCLVRDLERASFLRALGCELVRGDVTDGASVRDAIGDGVEAVVHLVGILMESRGATFRAVHVAGTRNVVEACVEAGVKRYIHISALGTRDKARSEYHRTKWEAEEIIRSSALDYTVFRPSVIFGKEDRFTTVLARAIRLSPIIMVPGTGQNLMQPIFVKDLVKAMASCLDDERTYKKVFEVAGPQAHTFDGIIDIIAGVLKKSPPLKAHIPMGLMRINAAIAEAVLPKPFITRDALLMLEEDNVTRDNALESFFSVKPTGLADGLGTYLPN